MMKMNIGTMNLLNGKRVLVSVMAWGVVTCASLLFAPKNILASLSLDHLVTAYGQFIGLGLIIGVAYFLSQLFAFIVDEAIVNLRQKRTVETIEAKVKLLDPAERALLREFFLQGQTILTLPQNELAVKNLVDTNILEVLGNERHYAIQGPTADYKISMQARVYLNRDVLRLPAGEPSAEEMSYLIKTRPHFINGLVQARKHAA
ncbi:MULTISPECIES: superinfection exclusion B family protein [Shewanella]|uniref:Superinfection exclusion B family protein n=1 Tax=Shewanella metallivivens TaxID=2872342 RepID=A0ABT5TR55_9GAMM|nr:superinfection exclusion B family protein [Shewanella metallivivens]MDD8061107.1 superinfection exclusion B family protein [Shewanella metallivivens]